MKGERQTIFTSAEKVLCIVDPTVLCHLKVALQNVFKEMIHMIVPSVLTLLVMKRSVLLSCR